MLDRVDCYAVWGGLLWFVTCFSFVTNQPTLRNKPEERISQVTKIVKNGNRKYVDKIFFLVFTLNFAKTDFLLKWYRSFLEKFRLFKIPFPRNWNVHRQSMKVLHKACLDHSEFSVYIRSLPILILSYQIRLYFQFLSVPNGNKLMAQTKFRQNTEDM
jgi:hypothetical protein